LGYRFVLRNSVFDMNENELTVEINLENVGFARPSKYREVYLVLKNTSTDSTHSFLIDSDIRTWETSVAISQKIDLLGLPEGSYHCYLHLPDTSSVLKDRPEYSIRFANVDLWDNTSGYNQLNQIVIVTGVTSNKARVWHQDIIVYPNPTERYLFIKNPGITGPLLVSTLNPEGKVIGKRNIEVTVQPGGEVRIDISDFPMGIYLLTIKSANSIRTAKVIKTDV
jgi:hypothetical protein